MQPEPQITVSGTTSMASSHPISDAAFARTDRARRAMIRPRDRNRLPPVATARRRADLLGWTSIGLGVALIVAAGFVARATGVGNRPGRRWIARAIGAREILSGAAILSKQRPASAVWARTGGDVLDLALLGAAFAWPTTSRAQCATRIGATMASVAAIGIVDAITASQLSKRQPQQHKVAAVTVNIPLVEAQGAWSMMKTTVMPSFRPAPGERGTEVRIDVDADDVSRKEAHKLVHQFKQLVETGEVMRSDASIHRRPHAARPTTDFVEREVAP